MKMTSKLIGQVRHCLELVLPKLGDFYCLSLVVLVDSTHPLFICVAQQFGEVLRLDRVQDVEEIFPGRSLSNGVLLWKVLGELRVLVEHRPQVLDREFVVVRNSDGLDL